MPILSGAGFAFRNNIMNSPEVFVLTKITFLVLWRFPILGHHDLILLQWIHKNAELGLTNLNELTLSRKVCYKFLTQPARGTAVYRCLWRR
jgi:hypothetical protein